MNRENNQSVFDNYVSSYDKNDEMIVRKYYHSYRVASICAEIGVQLGSGQSDVFWLLGLLHDIARFEQARQFHSFDDNATFDHGDYGAKILFDEGLITQFDVDAKYYESIKNGIMCHNKLEFNNSDIFCQAIRDADKIDIFYQVDKRIYICDVTEVNINPAIMEYIYNRRLVPNRLVKTKADKMLWLCAMIFDINLPCSMDIIKERGNYKSFVSSSFVGKDKKLFDMFCGKDTLGKR